MLGMLMGGCEEQRAWPPPACSQPRGTYGRVGKPGCIKKGQRIVEGNKVIAKGGVWDVSMGLVGAGDGGKRERTVELGERGGLEE